jgi:hypothetical protein
MKDNKEGKLVKVVSGARAVGNIGRVFKTKYSQYADQGQKPLHGVGLSGIMVEKNGFWNHKHSVWVWDHNVEVIDEG